MRGADLCLDGRGLDGRAAVPEELADQEAEGIASIRDAKVSMPSAESLAEAIDRVRADRDFTERARTLLERDKELLDRLAR